MLESRRVEWVDILKGFAIPLVALYHSAALGVKIDYANPVWSTLNTALEAFRMPVFFFASGIFARSVIARPWRRMWSSRLALLVWAFLLWTVIRYLYFLAVPMPSRPWETDPVALLLAPVWPTSGLWFLHALVVFFVVAKLFEAVPAWIQVSGAAVLSIGFFSTLSTGNLSYDGMGAYLLFFMLGLHLRDVVLRQNEDARPLLALIAIALLGAAILGVIKFGSMSTPLVGPLLGAGAVVAGSLLARTAESSPLRRPLAYIGRNTLPIYVQHVILIAAVYTILGNIAPSPLAPWAGYVIPLVIAATVVAVSLAVGAFARRTRALHFLFEAPRWFSGETVNATGSSARRA